MSRPASARTCRLRLSSRTRPGAPGGARATTICSQARRVGVGLARCVARLRPAARPAPGDLEVLHRAARRARARRRWLDPANGAYVLRLLDRAIAGCLGGEFAAMVTAPVHKGVINDAGIPFTGHTEYLAEQTRHVTGGDDAGGRRRCASRWRPRICRCAQLPMRLRRKPRRDHSHPASRSRRPLRHCRTRASWWPVSIRMPARADISGARKSRSSLRCSMRLRARGHGPARPAAGRHAVHAAHARPTATAVLAMYHDQGLPVLKHASFGGGVNVTLGLPIMRTSVDHGTALDLAGSGRADPGSLLAAVELAIEMARAPVVFRRDASVARARLGDLRRGALVLDGRRLPGAHHFVDRGGDARVVPGRVDPQHVRQQGHEVALLLRVPRRPATRRSRPSS